MNAMFGPGTPYDTVVVKPFYAANDLLAQTSLGNPGTIMSLQSNGVTAPVGELGAAIRGLSALRPGTAIVQDIPTLAFSRTTTPFISDHIEAAIADGQPSVLTRLEGRDAIRAQRADALNGQAKPDAGYSLDAYPFASSQQGGSGARASPVPIREQNIQGGMLSSFYQNNNINHGDPFRVIIAP